MWLIILSDQLRIEGLVSHYLTNYLIRRGPLSRRELSPPKSLWGAYPVLASVSRRYSEPKGRFPRVTHPCATVAEATVRLACVRHAASVRSEPGSNSQVQDASEKALETDRQTHPKPKRTKTCYSLLASTSDANRRPRFVPIPNRNRNQRPTAINLAAACASLLTTRYKLVHDPADDRTGRRSAPLRGGPDAPVCLAPRCGPVAASWAAPASFASGGAL